MKPRRRRRPRPTSGTRTSRRAASGERSDGKARGRRAHLLLAEIPPQGLAAFRVLFGVFLFAYFARYLPHVPLMFSHEGVYAPVVVGDVAPPPWGAWAAYLGLQGALVLFVLGVRTAIVTPLVFALYLHHFFLNIATRNTSFDRLIILLLFVACFAKLDGAWTIGRRPEAAAVPAWPARLLALQMALLYFGSGVWKLLSPAWHDGRMLEMTLLGPWGTPAAFELVRIGWPRLVWDLMTWGVIAFELGVGFALFVPRLRKPAMALALSFHVANWVLLSIPEFMVCVTVYPLFLDPAQLRAFPARLGRAASRPRSPLPAPGRPRFAGES